VRSYCQPDSEVHGCRDSAASTQDDGDCGQRSHLQSAFHAGCLFFAGLSRPRLPGLTLSSDGPSRIRCFFLLPGRPRTGVAGVQRFAAARAVEWNRVGQITNSKFCPTVWAVQQMDCHVSLLRKNQFGPCDLRPLGLVLQIVAVFDLKVSRCSVRISGSGVAKRFVGLPDLFVTGTHEP